MTDLSAGDGSGLRHRALVIGLRAFALFAIVTGTLDIIVGLRLLAGSGAAIPAPAALDPMLNSHIKYMGAVWCGFGVALLWTVQNLRERAAMLHILLGTVFLGGMGRALSAVLFGVGSPLLAIFIAIELGGPVAVWVWHRRLPPAAYREAQSPSIATP